MMVNPLNTGFLAALIGAVLMLSGCATPTQPRDYSAFKQSRPRSILVMPPLNSSPDVKAPFGLLAQVTYPLAESGYYVFPVTVVYETFKQNGLDTPGEMHAVSLEKLRKIFGADAVLYLDVKEYGAVYRVFQSEVAVSVHARLVDLKTSQQLWSGNARASSAETDSQDNSNNNGLAKLLVKALVNQMINSASDRSYEFAGVASQRLLTAGRGNGLLYGPYSPLYQTD